MKLLNQLSGVSKVVLTAAVITTLVTGCNRRNEVEPTAAAVTQPDTAAMSNNEAGTNTANSMGGTTAGSAVIADNSNPSSSTLDTTSGAVANGSSASGIALNDAQIQGVLMTANDAEINAGKLAEAKSANAQVKEFASKMIKHHEDANKQVAVLSNKISTSPGQSEATKMLKEDADKTAAYLATEKGSAFDKAYMDSQVADHEKVLHTIDATLLPNTKNAELTALLEKIRPIVSAHLVQAKLVQASLK